MCGPLNSFCHGLALLFLIYTFPDFGIGVIDLFRVFKSSHRGSAETNLTSICENTGSIPGLAQWVKDWVVL